MGKIIIRSMSPQTTADQNITVPPRDRDLHDLAAIWTDACGEALSTSERMVSYCLRHSADAAQSVFFALDDGSPVGVVLVGAMTGDATIYPPGLGWCNAIAVDPCCQRRGIGTALMQRAEKWAAEKQCTHLLLGGGRRPFVPGLPTELATEEFFRQRGFVLWADAPATDNAGMIWDLAANLAGYATPACVKEVAGVVQPMRPTDMKAVREFLAREFPGRRLHEFDEHLREDGRVSDYMVLWIDRGIGGFCRLTFEDSKRPIECFHPHPLPRPWGQLGPVDVAIDLRGQGYEAALLDAGLRRLHNNGINGCVADRIDQIEFYAEFGFERFRAYRQLMKPLP